MGALPVLLQSRQQQLLEAVEAAPNTLAQIGALTQDLATLQDQQAHQQRITQTPSEYFARCAQASGIDPNRDYALQPRTPQITPVCEDQEFDVRFVRPLRREQLAHFLIRVEGGSNSFRCVKADLALDPRQAASDLWSARFTLLWRRPSRSAQ